MLKIAQGDSRKDKNSPAQLISSAENDSSPISGGSILGDKIRMNQYYLDEGVFRSTSN